MLFYCCIMSAKLGVFATRGFLGQLQSSLRACRQICQSNSLKWLGSEGSELHMFIQDQNIFAEELEECKFITFIFVQDCGGFKTVV